MTPLVVVLVVSIGWAGFTTTRRVRHFLAQRALYGRHALIAGCDQVTYTRHGYHRPTTVEVAP